MAYLFWNNGRMEVPSCNQCGSFATQELQELVNNDRKIRKIFVDCAACSKKEYLGTFEHLGGHNFTKIRD